LRYFKSIPAETFPQRSFRWVFITFVISAGRCTGAGCALSLLAVDQSMRHGTSHCEMLGASLPLVGLHPGPRSKASDKASCCHIAGADSSTLFSLEPPTLLLTKGELSVTQRSSYPSFHLKSFAKCTAWTTCYVHINRMQRRETTRNTWA